MERMFSILTKIMIVALAFLWLDEIFKLFDPMAQLELSMLQMENTDEAYYAINAYQMVGKVISIGKVAAIIAVFANDTVYYIKKFSRRKK